MRIIITLLLLGTNIGFARPISYPTGWTIMQMNDWEQSRLHIHYSPNVNNSVGIAIENKNEVDETNINLQWNYLLGRKNTKHSQANLYLKTAGGLSILDDDEAGNFSMFIAGDWETRRYFTSYEAGFLYSDTYNNGSFSQKARVGVAPYVAEYGNLHTWLMLQLEHHPEASDDNQFKVTPMVRLFKGDYLAELGVNFDGDVMFNWVVRF